MKIPVAVYSLMPYPPAFRGESHRNKMKINIH